MIAACPRRGAHIAAFWIPVCAGAAYFGLGWQLAAFVLCPLFYVLPIILFWAEVLDHGRLNLISPVRAARTHVGPLSLPFYPYGEGYHLVHHLHPGIPGHRLAEAHRELTGAACFSTCAAPPRSVDETVRELARA
jgi:fatty acid desaturase